MSRCSSYLSRIRAPRHAMSVIGLAYWLLLRTTLVKAGSPRIRGAQRRAARRYLNVDLLTEHKETLRQAA